VECKIPTVLDSRFRENNKLQNQSLQNTSDNIGKNMKTYNRSILTFILKILPVFSILTFSGCQIWNSPRVTKLTSPIAQKTEVDSIPRIRLLVSEYTSTSDFYGTKDRPEQRTLITEQYNARYPGVFTWDEPALYMQINREYDSYGGYEHLSSNLSLLSGGLIPTSYSSSSYLTDTYTICSNPECNEPDSITVVVRRGEHDDQKLISWWWNDFESIRIPNDTEIWEYFFVDHLMSELSEPVKRDRLEKMYAQVEAKWMAEHPVLAKDYKSVARDDLLRQYLAEYTLASKPLTQIPTPREKTGDRPLERWLSKPTVWTPEARRCMWVLAVGVSQYKNPQVPALPFARSDAEKVQNWFHNLDVEGITRENIHVLFDEQATRENLLAQIDWLRKQALPEDAVFVYFAGHGAPELSPDGTSVDAKYLVLYNTDPSQLFATGLPIDELTRRLESVKAKTQVLILEACYAGPVGQEILKKTPTADLEIRPRLIQQLGEQSGRVILSASSGRQMAIGSDEIKGSLFTHYLLDAWGDGSQRLLSDQFEEARYQVRRESNRLGSLQEPAKFGDQNVDVVLKVR